MSAAAEPSLKYGGRGGHIGLRCARRFVFEHALGRQ
jgi:hypothetical protein